MELFLFGMVFGIALSVGGFVMLNLEIPAQLDDFEADIRDVTKAYQTGKTELWAKIKRRLGK